jgi:hypothetical protein
LSEVSRKLLCSPRVGMTVLIFIVGTGNANSQFGQCTATRDPRILQWAVRMQF